MAKRNHHTNPAAEARWEASPEQKKRRAQRNAARDKMAKKGLVHKGDGKEVDHKHFTKDKNDSLDNSSGNLRVVSRETNRKKQPNRKKLKGF